MAQQEKRCKICGRQRPWSARENKLLPCLCTVNMPGRLINLPPRATNEQARLNTLARPLGLEVELAEWGEVGNMRTTTFSYRQTHDGSVIPSGQEMVINPLAGDAFIRAMMELAKITYQGGAQVNGTCGLHVHVDATDLSYWEVRRLVMMYLGMENEIYGRLISRERAIREGRERYYNLMPEDYVQFFWDNVATAKKTRDVKEQLTNFVYGVPRLSPEMLKMLSATKKDKYAHALNQGARSRYLGLNLHSWFHRGTIEFRMKEGTLELAELVNWPLWCGWLVELSTKLSDAKVLKSTGVEEFTRLYMPEFLGNWVAGKDLHTLPGGLPRITDGRRPVREAPRPMPEPLDVETATGEPIGFDLAHERMEELRDNLRRTVRTNRTPTAPDNFWGRMMTLEPTPPVIQEQVEVTTTPPLPNPGPATPGLQEQTRPYIVTRNGFRYYYTTPNMDQPTRPAPTTEGGNR